MRNSPSLRAFHPTSVDSEGKVWTSMFQRSQIVRRSNDNKLVIAKVMGIRDLSDIVAPQTIGVTYMDTITGAQHEAIILPGSPEYELSDDGDSLIRFKNFGGTALVDSIGYHEDDIDPGEAGEVAMDAAGPYARNVIEDFRPIVDDLGYLMIDPKAIPTGKQN